MVRHIGRHALRITLKYSEVWYRRLESMVRHIGRHALRVRFAIV